MVIAWPAADTLWAYIHVSRMQQNDGEGYALLTHQSILHRHLCKVFDGHCLIVLQDP